MERGLRANIFHDLTFHYPRSSPDYDEVKNKVISHGGTMVSLPELARIKLAHVPYYDVGGFYDASLLDDSISAEVLQDISDYKISPDIGYAWITSERQVRKLHANGNLKGMEGTELPPRQPSPSKHPGPGMTQIPFRPEPITRYDDVYILRGRTPYSTMDDMRIIDFVNQYKNQVDYSPTGTKLWEFAFQLRLIPGRSDQSMRGRFIKTIRPRFEKEFAGTFANWKSAGHSWTDPY